LGHKVYRQPIHTNLYMNAGSYYNLTPKAVLSTVAHKTFYGQDSLHWLWNCNTRACSDSDHSNQKSSSS